jgi:hypothetical protein
VLLDPNDHRPGLIPNHRAWLFGFDGVSRALCSPPASPARDLNVLARNDGRSAAVLIRDLCQFRQIAWSRSQVLVVPSGYAAVFAADGTSHAAPAGRRVPTRLMPNSGCARTFETRSILFTSLTVMMRSTPERS